jgi:hypothetical protein
MRSDGQELGVVRDTPGYSRALTQELVQRIWRNGVLRTRLVLFNDMSIPGVRFEPNHDDHLHVRFYPPGGGSTEALDPEVEARARARTRSLAGATGGWVGIDAESGRQPERPFLVDVIKRVRQAYRENNKAGRAKRVDRASCIVMLNIGLGHLLGLPMKERPARSTLNGKPVKARKIKMGNLPTKSIEQAMAELQRRGLAHPPIAVDFLDRRGRTAGTLAPVRLKGSVAQAVLANTGPQEGWYGFGLSIMDGYHSVLLLVQRTGTGARIYWMDQFSTGINDDVTISLDERVTSKTIAWWQEVLAKKKKRFNTVARIWVLRNRGK